jgi:hypothetical protein
LTLGDQKEYFSNHTNYKQLKNALIKYVTDFSILLGADEDVGSSAKDLYDFEQKLAMVSKLC